MHRLMIQDPDRFAEQIHHHGDDPYVNIGFQDEVLNPAARRNGHLPEDWNRFYWLLEAYEKCTNNHAQRSVLSFIAQYPYPDTFAPQLATSLVARQIENGMSYAMLIK